MQRQPLLDLLHRYAETHPEEGETIAEFRRFVAGEPRCFERSLPHGHLTGSAWVASPDAHAVLLTHHAKLDIWVQLGGHADGNPDLRDVARREAEEESGLRRLRLVDDAVFDLDIHLIPARKGEPEHLHYDVRFAFTHEGDEKPVVTAESHDLAWVSLTELERYTREPSMLRMKRKWLARLPPRP